MSPAFCKLSVHHASAAYWMPCCLQRFSLLHCLHTGITPKPFHFMQVSLVLLVGSQQLKLRCHLGHCRLRVNAVRASVRQPLRFFSWTQKGYRLTIIFFSFCLLRTGSAEEFGEKEKLEKGKIWGGWRGSWRKRQPACCCCCGIQGSCCPGTSSEAWWKRGCWALAKVQRGSYWVCRIAFWLFNKPEKALARKAAGDRWKEV